MIHHARLKFMDNTAQASVAFDADDSMNYERQEIIWISIIIEAQLFEFPVRIFSNIHPEIYTY